MPVYRLTKELIFPPPALAEDGLLAVGGDLSVDRLILAYSQGIFPWYSQGEPIMWWSPDPRMVLFPESFRCTQRLARTIRQGVFEVTFDQAFPEVIRACSTAPRPGQDGTWITRAMVEAYCALHAAGYAHSIECWREGALVGGLYGVSLGACFFGESMFSRESNASKVAFARLVECAKGWNFDFIDCQVANKHLRSLGAREIPRKQFLTRLQAALAHETRRGRWGAQDSGSIEEVLT
ncbi:MAG: leucyl/phenylalanyl-tRNA--protein transferase [Candidatus Hydrogenedentes bacterium]|nr:leucyl/phenylalanyl-tRNA--protein transferase [Candidatus Hydrogenedentota bacterium]